MTAIVAYWEELDPPYLKSWDIGWGEPFCFACGWLAPVLDGPKAWFASTRWLDRAHLWDHCDGGPDEPHNLMPICHLCHLKMPEMRSAEDGLQWVRDQPRVEWGFQLWTDSMLWGRAEKQVSRTTTMIHSRMQYLEAINGWTAVPSAV